MKATYRSDWTDATRNREVRELDEPPWPAKHDGGPSAATSSPVMVQSDDMRTLTLSTQAVSEEAPTVNLSTFR
jgi:hypothetical protein